MQPAGRNEHHSEEEVYRETCVIVYVIFPQ